MRKLQMWLPASIAIVVCSLLPFHSFADKFFEDNDAFFLKYLKQDKFNIDTSASAVVLYEYNSYDLHSSDAMMKHEVRRIIKIIKKNGSAYADINIPLPVSRFYFYRVNKVHGTTYNLENGRIVKQEIDGDNISLETSNLVKEQKVSMPAVREGSIIDYSFEIEEENYPLNIADWYIQERIPKLYSRAEIFINHRALYKADDPITLFPEIEESKKSLDDNLLPNAYTYAEVVGEDLREQYWVRKNIRAFEPEPYLPNENNFREAMNIHITAMHTIGVHPILSTWTEINQSLIESYYFYRTFPETSAPLKEKIRELRGSDTSELSIAKKIFRFVCDSITTSDYARIFTHKDVLKVLDDRSGTPAETNFLLIALLRHAGLDCNPVILATKENAPPNMLEPNLSKFNHTICQLRTNGAKYYLDATKKYNPFGRIPPECLNGYARVISKSRKDTCGLVFNPEMAVEKSFYSMATTNSDIKDYTLNCKFYYGDESAIGYRTDWNGDTNKIKTYLISLLKEMPFAKLKDYKVLNLADADKQLTMDFNISIAWPADGSMVYINPYVKFFENNPFKNPTRKYPIELPAVENRTFAFNMKLPDGYTVDEMPKPGVIQIDQDNQYKNMLEYNKETNSINIRATLKMQRIYYRPDEYDMLKEFFRKMSEEQQKTVVIKKI